MIRGQRGNEFLSAGWYIGDCFVADNGRTRGSIVNNQEGVTGSAGPEHPSVRFVTKKGDEKALSKFMDAVKQLIVDFSDELAQNQEDDFECSLTLEMTPVSLKTPVGLPAEG